jgi:hypothetical protein
MVITSSRGPADSSCCLFSPSQGSTAITRDRAQLVAKLRLLLRENATAPNYKRGVLPAREAPSRQGEQHRKGEQQGKANSKREKAGGKRAQGKKEQGQQGRTGNVRATNRSGLAAW